MHMAPRHAVVVWIGLAVLCAAISEAGGFLPAAVVAARRYGPALVGARSGLPHAPTAAQIRRVRPLCAVPGWNKLGPAARAGYEKLGIDENKRSENTAKAVDSIHRPSLALEQAVNRVKLLERDCFAHFNAAVNEARGNTLNHSLLVYGARGVSKTSMVAGALQGAAGVVTMSYQGDGLDFEERLELLLLKGAGRPTDGPKADLGDRLRAILTFYQRAHNRRPIVVIEINSKMEPAALTNLLLATKQLGFEEELATFVIVVSASRSALGLTIGIVELRVEGYPAPDFNTTEAQAYLAQNLGRFHGLAGTVIDLVGTRAMHLANVWKLCRGAESQEEYLERVMGYRVARILDAQSALDGFLAIAKKNVDFKKAASLEFFVKLLAGTPSLVDRDAVVAFGVDDLELLLTALAKYHVFAIDPFDHSVSMQSHFMQTAIERHLQAAGSGVAGTSAA